ncbi:hypothetical protein ACI2KS_23050 [Pseudomonas sp. NPDC087358]|uniref:hypothetical protein n=1 Tax=Pseudomonas sp. NPDC087358 TaxID=3364439 RepID=UPI00384BD360
MAEITYVLVVPTDEATTLFQGWSRAATSNDFLLLMGVVSVAPFDTGEVFINQQKLIELRCGGTRRNVVTIGSQLITEIPKLINSAFVVVLALPQDIDEIKKLKFSDSIHRLLVSTERAEGVINVTEYQSHITAQFLDYHIYRLMIEAKKIFAPKAKIPKMRAAFRKIARCTFYQAGCTVANELVLIGLGFRPSMHKYIDPRKVENYYDAVYESAQAVLAMTDEHKEHVDEAIIYSPAIYGALYDVNSHFWNQILREIKLPFHRNFIKNGLIKNPEYSGWTVNNANADTDHPSKDPMTSTITKERQRELRITNFTVGLLAGTESLPAIRLPNSVNLHLSKLKEIERIYNMDDKKSKLLLQVKFKALSDSLRSAFGSKLYYIIASRVLRCKICSDVPLEWVYLDKLPLMISHEVSKIPMTPGNMLLQLSTMGRFTTLKLDVLQNILIIRSFSKSDKLGLYLEAAIKLFPISTKSKISIVDVSSIEEVVAALNTFEGAIVIFDCHGNHGGIKDTGWLEIGTEKLISWELHGKAKIPPIVMLSACSTSAISGSHASVANGFLRCGALSVIGTFLPVDALSSSAFMARIIYRVDTFLPLLKGMGYDAITWRVCISQFLKMSYSTDVLDFFTNSEYGLTDKDNKKIHFEVNLRINSLDPAWYDYLINEVSQVLGVGDAELFTAVKEQHPLMETMFYCQLGRPELLNIIL